MDSPLDQATRLIESERAQIAHEIHDGLLPLLFAASATLSSVTDSDQISELDEAAQKKLQQVSGWLRDAMQDGRRLLTEVYPPELVGTVWTKAAADALERLFADSQTKIRWQVDPTVNETTAPVAFAAYRIVVESVRNAVRHGKASLVTIDGSKDDSGMTLTISDDGSGFEPTQDRPDRFGIRSMKGRAELVQGTLAIDSAPGGPTKVTFQVATMG